MARSTAKSSTARTTQPRRKRISQVSSKLAPYHAKRDFALTPEPSGRKKAAKPAQGLQFVVQKHAARNLHYDFRLELAGVLLSWSVPKGPSLKPGERRLAMRTEDHPLDYADFEGIIPKGEYGGGTVIVWDRGEWLPEDDAEKGMKSGRLTFELKGAKLQGRFHLVRTRVEPSSKREQWLLFKGKGEGANDSFDIDRDQTESVLSGRTLEQVADEPDRVWHSNREPKAEKTKTKTKKASAKRPQPTAAAID
ncbi:MAG: DNA polymerase ligase N-terminal domain-containing protein, partial [Polyangiales bacterium]